MSEKEEQVDMLFNEADEEVQENKYLMCKIGG